MNGYKELITHLQELPRLIVPVKIYPHKEGKYQESKYYATANDEGSVNALIDYLPFLSRWKSLIFEARNDKVIKNLAEGITASSYYIIDKINAVHNWVFHNIEYQVTKEVIPPSELVVRKKGDCKSFTTLIAALLGVLGIKSWVKLVQMKGYEARHIYNYVRTSWYPVDGTGLYCFQEVKRVTGYILYQIDDTPDMPPEPLPSPGEAEIVPPPILTKGGDILSMAAILLMLGAIKKNE